MLLVLFSDQHKTEEAKPMRKKERSNQPSSLFNPRPPLTLSFLVAFYVQFPFSVMICDV